MKEKMNKIIKIGAILMSSSLIFTTSLGAVDASMIPETSVEATIKALPAQSILATIIKEDDVINEKDKVEEYVLPDTVYTTTRVNVRCAAEMDSDILITAATGTQLTRIGINVIDGWDVVLIDDTEYYMANEYLTTEIPNEVAKDIVKQIEDSKTVSSISSNDLRYLSAIIFAEAGNQCMAGQQAVGIIVMNRSASSSFADGVYNVIYQPGQFTPVTNGSLNKALNKYDSGLLPESCIEAATYALQGNKTVYYNGITYDLSDYYSFSRYVSNARLVIEDHMFK